MEAPAPDAIKEGGENPSERRCTFMELALCLMPGLSAAAVNVLYKAASPSMQVRLACSGNLLPVKRLWLSINSGAHLPVQVKASRSVQGSNGCKSGKAVFSVVMNKFPIDW